MSTSFTCNSPSGRHSIFVDEDGDAVLASNGTDILFIDNGFTLPLLGEIDELIAMLQETKAELESR